MVIADCAKNGTNTQLSMFWHNIDLKMIKNLPEKGKPALAHKRRYNSTAKTRLVAMC
jgi:hypothetical protein